MLKSSWALFHDSAPSDTASGTGIAVSAQQAGIWLHSQLGNERDLYNLVYTRRFERPLDDAAARRAVAEIVRRHAALRVRFRVVDGVLKQELVADATVPWTHARLDGLDEAQQRACIDQAHAQEQPFDLAEGPLLRFEHLELSGRYSVLVLAVHHICFDALSMTVFEREFDALYAAYAAGLPCDLPTPAMSYFDYCRAQQSQVAGQAFQRQLEYWRDRLDGLPAVHSLPVDASRRETYGHRGKVHSATLDADVSRRIKALSASFNASLFSVIHALFALLIARHGNTADVVVGVPFAKRSGADGSGAALEDLIGQFADPVVLRLDCRPSLSFAELVAAARETSLESLLNADVPFASLVNELHRDRSGRAPPLFQIMLNMVDGAMHGDGEAGGGFEVVAGDQAKYDLTLYVAERGDERIEFHFNYNADLFEAEWIGGLQRHLFNLAESAAAAPDRNIYALAMLGAEEQAQLLALGQGEAAEPAPFQPLIARFEAQAQRTPDRVAAVDEHESATFAELAARVERIAAAVRAACPQAQRGEFLVALHGPRGVATVASMLGVLKAGGAFVCLDAEASLARNRAILEDARPALLLCADPAAWREALPEPTALLDLAEALAFEPTAADAGREVRADELMYVVYTSGSTGRPKGVMVEHRQFAGFVPGFAQQCRALGVESPDSWLINHAFTFDPALIGLALLCAGTRVVILSAGQMQEPAEILRLIERYEVPIFKTSPSLAVALIDGIARAGHAPHLIVGGDDTSAHALERLSHYCARFGRKALNAYGPTETTVNCAFDVIDGKVTLGRPMPGCAAYVLGEGRSLLPRGSVGELYIGGDCVARGYLGMESLTREAFVDSPFPASERGRLYRTGDFVRWLDDGRLQFVGRRDTQVKVRGYRVEAGEVEHAILATGLVRDVRVMFEPQAQQLLAFAIVDAQAGAGEGAQADPALIERVRLALHERLPAYMHPARYACLHAWPSTRHGKLDRHALMNLPAVAAIADAGRAPVGELELKLAEAWSSLLNVPLSSIGADSCFFKLGGHSLIAIQLTSRLYQSLGCMLQVRDVLEHSRFADLAERIRSPLARAGAVPIATVSAPSADGAARFPASYSQNKFWLVDNLSESGKRFNVVMRIELPRDCDPGLVRQALDAVVARHEALRTTFEHAESLWQVVHERGQCGLGVVDLRGCDADERARRLDDVLAAEDALVRDLRTGPLIGATLVQLPECGALLVNLHHIVCDAWSNEQLAQELRAAYAALAQGRPVDLPALPIQYRDYSAWQHAALQQRLPVLEAYWTQRLDGLPLVHGLPLDFARPASPSSVGAFHSHRIDPALHKALSTLFLNHKATLFVGLQALFSAFLARWSGQDDIVLGTATANRDHPDTRHLIGALVDTGVVRNEVREDRSFVDHLQAVREQTLDDQAHFDMPFEALVRTLNPERNGGYSPLFQLVLNLIYSDNDIVGFEGGESGVGGGQTINVNYDLTLYAKPSEQGLELTWCYAADLFKPSTIARMASSLETLLAAVVADPAQRLGALPLVNGSDREGLAALAQGPALQRETVLVPALIERHALERGDKVALSLEDETLSFAELDARANQIARLLATSGVQAGDRVGVCQERTLDMLASVIGTMKAGAVYVPLDPGYPDERLAYLLSDAGIGHVLTEAYLAPQLPLSAQRVVLVSDADEQDATAFASPVKAESPAYMIYTSGSTGQPKGVVVSHGALADKLAALAQNYGLDETDRCLLFASTSFDASISQLLTTLSVGGSVALRPDGVTEPEALLAYVAAQDVTWMHVVPAYLRQLLEVPGWSDTKLRRVSSGGDVLDRGLQQAWFVPERSGIALYNSYGPTEVTITSSVHRVRGDEAVVPIGRPLANTRYWVLDEQGHATPRGAVGELCIGGSSLADGYWGRDQQTRERFVELEPVPGQRERLYRSGDRARWNELGELEFVGRNDHQVKVRGYRIELGEIEAALQACDGVTGAVVKVEQDSLWAYVSLSSGDLANVEAQLSSRLPSYLLPGGYERMDEWPLTRSGKVDRNALVRGHASAPKRRAPGNEVETSLLEIWSTLLKTDDIGVTDNFFQRGGHSLLATRLASQIRRRFEVDFTLKSLFELPSIEEQAVFIDVLKDKAAASERSEQGTEAVEEFSL
ncbi:non-ribosomal peptide synthetase [Lysobacter enzymogenes]|uniref:non-ribosomal peptide synthetase n=1 Tax=Lysobacter enzymogenes TaxID=69 RepID=UPI001A976F3F|nr:non-ribosomal peptide synthetase [Lysobacter enzymogenes]QQP97295.1 amino acid adenylation domain-containing protein [Lysobacter enzymogenes]